MLILRRARRELAGLTGAPFERVEKAIQSLGDDPRPHGSRKLIGEKLGVFASVTTVSFMRLMIF